MWVGSFENFQVGELGGEQGKKLYVGLEEREKKKERGRSWTVLKERGSET